MIINNKIHKNKLQLHYSKKTAQDIELKMETALERHRPCKSIIPVLQQKQYPANVVKV